jgi:hypothetical protein
MFSHLSMLGDKSSLPMWQFTCILPFAQPSMRSEENSKLHIDRTIYETIDDNLIL